MLVLPITAQGLLVIHLAGGVIDALAREEQNEKNGDDDKRHKRRGFLSIKMPEESLSSEAEAIIACFCGKRKHVTP